MRDCTVEARSKRREIRCEGENTGDAREMRGRCTGDAREMHGRCTHALAHLHHGGARGVGAEFADESLHVRLGLRLRLGHALVGAQHLRARALEVIIVALVPCDGLVEEVEHVCADVVQKGSRVRDDDEGLAPSLKVGLQPEHRVQVQMVGGLVEQQDVGGDEERAGEGHAPVGGTGFERVAVIQPAAGLNWSWHIIVMRGNESPAGWNPLPRACASRQRRSASAAAVRRS